MFDRTNTPPPTARPATADPVAPHFVELAVVVVT